MKKLFEIKETIASNIRRLRYERKISTFTLSKLSKLSESTIYECQRKHTKHILSLLAFIKIAYALEVSLDELLKEKTE